MITEDYVSFETAKLLKEKGFNEKCQYIYLNNGFLTDAKSTYTADVVNSCIILARQNALCTAPTLQMAMKWLRKIYSLEIYPYHDFPKVGDKWWIEIIKYPNSVSEYESETTYNSYEEACEAAIKYCLENLI